MFDFTEKIAQLEKENKDLRKLLSDSLIEKTRLRSGLFELAEANAELRRKVADLCADEDGCGKFAEQLGDLVLSKKVSA